VKSRFLFLNIFLALVVMFMLNQVAFAQVPATKPILERTLTLKITNERVDAILNKIAMQGKFSFSYNSAIIDVSKIFSGYFVKKPVREILNEIFDGKVEYKEKGGYLILQKAKSKEVKAQPNEWITYNGYVRDEKGEPIPYASVYDKESLESTVSNAYGFYRIKFDLKQLPLNLSVSKSGYVDTSAFLDQNIIVFNNYTLRKYLPPLPVKVPEPNHSESAEETAGSFFKNLENTNNALNISDTIYRKFQASVLPYIGTNGKMGMNVINDYSFNLFGGYSLGVRKAELSGMFNLNRGDVEFLELAGFVNLCGGKVRGLQMAGFTNLVRKDVNGCQMAGFVNFDWENFEGVQLAGFVNTVRGKVQGVQIAGFVNTAVDTIKGFQLSAFCNVANKSMTGTQLTGFCNVTIDTLNGTQIGFVNYAKQLNGGQLGFVNVSKSTTGVPIGFLSYVHNGYHKVEVSADEVIPLNVALRTGVTSFHNIIIAGLHPGTGDTLLWNFGYGFGTSIKLSSKTLLDFDLTSSQIVMGDNLKKINLINKVYLGVDTRLSKHMSLAGGLTLNGQLTKTNYYNYPDIYTYIEPNIFYTKTWQQEQTKLQMWLGAKIALRFF